MLLSFVCLISIILNVSSFTITSTRSYKRQQSLPSTTDIEATTIPTSTIIKSFFEQLSDLSPIQESLQPVRLKAKEIISSKSYPQGKDEAWR